jgi:hypothetical protein
MAVERKKNHDQGFHYELHIPRELMSTSDPAIDILSNQNKVSAESNLANIDAKVLLQEKAKRLADLRKECTDPSTPADEAREKLRVLIAEELVDVPLDKPLELPVGNPTGLEIAEEVFLNRILVHHDIANTFRDGSNSTDAKRGPIKRHLVALVRDKERIDDLYAPTSLAPQVRGNVTRVLGFIDNLIAKSPHLTGALQLVPDSMRSDLIAKTGTKAVRR